MATVLIAMKPGATAAQAEAVAARLRQAGARTELIAAEPQVVLGIGGDRIAIDEVPWEAMAGVDRAVPLARTPRTVITSPVEVVRVGGVAIGGGQGVVIAGPCAVESREQLTAAAQAVRAAGARVLRGDAFKPRTSPYAFQGLGEKALELLAEVRQLTGLPFVAEVLDPRDVELVSSYADCIRVGTRNMSNYALLTELGSQPKPVMLKRGMQATIEEWLGAAEYVSNAGNRNIILCERGIRTFETATRNTLDLGAVAVIKATTRLPVIVDPSHATGRRSLVAGLARAALAAGADGVMVDVHPSPHTAKVDGAQALSPEEFADLMAELHRIAAAVGLSL